MLYTNILFLYFRAEHEVTYQRPRYKPNIGWGAKPPDMFIEPGFPTMVYRLTIANYRFFQISLQVSILVVDSSFITCIYTLRYIKGDPLDYFKAKYSQNVCYPVSAWWQCISVTLILANYRILGMKGTVWLILCWQCNISVTVGGFHLCVMCRHVVSISQLFAFQNGCTCWIKERPTIAADKYIISTMSNCSRSPWKTETAVWR